MTGLESILTACSARKVRDYHMGFCPCHEDSVRSLRIWEYGGSVYVKCMAGCDWRAVREKLGLQSSYGKSADDKDRPRYRVVKEYEYVDRDGQHCLTVVRYEPKRFSQFRYYNERKAYGIHAGRYVLKDNVYLPARNGEGGQTVELPAARPCLYNEQAIANGDTALPVIFVEGEKDADTVTASGLAYGTCLSGGSSAKWAPKFNEVLEGRYVIVVPDCDAPGRSLASMVAYNLIGTASQLAIVDLDPDRNDGADVSDIVGADISIILDTAAAMPGTVTQAYKKSLAGEKEDDAWDVF